MASHTVTLDVPEDVYQRADRVARTTAQPVEKVIVDWITPPPLISDMIGSEIVELERLSDEELIHVARSSMPESDVARLRDLFAEHRERDLAGREQREVVTLVEREDLYTLRKARALFLLRKRNALPEDLGTLLDEMRHGIRRSRYAS